MIKIGVIIPTYERKELLLRALVSLQMQAYKDWEAYVVDDCSSENVEFYLEEQGMFIDKRIHYVRLEKNSGVNIARNLALEKILENETINYITLLDDDDYFLVDYFEKAVTVINKESCPWLVTKCVDENTDDITQIKSEGFIHYLDYLSADKIQNDATMMIKKELLHDIRFPTALKNGYEWYFFLQLSTKCDMYVKDTPSKVVTYLEDGLTKRKNKRNKNIQIFRKKAFNACGYNYYAFLSKKHEVIYRDKGKMISKIKYNFYKIKSYFA